MNWGEILVDALAGRAEVVPDGWSTSAQIQKETGQCGSVVREGLIIQIRQGKVERKNFRLLINGAIRSIPHYKEVKNDPKKTGRCV